MRLSQPKGNFHECFLQNKSDTCLAKLPPNASYIRRLWRRFRRYLLVSEKHDSTKYHFRSTAAMLLERKRQAQNFPSYIIHPFSMFSYYREIVLFFVLASNFLLSPISNTFLLQSTFKGHIGGVRWMNFCTEVLVMLNIPLNFISGYLEHQTKHIVLEPRKISKNYLKFFFWVDLIGAAPLLYFMPNVKEAAGQLIFVPKHLILYPRAMTMLLYFRHITLLLRVPDAQHEILRMTVLSLYMLHWSSCLLYGVQYMYFMREIPSDTWMLKAGIFPTEAQNVSVYTKYIWCLYAAVCHYYRVGAGIYDTHSVGDYIMFTAIMLVGAVYSAYIIVIVLQAIGTANASESKYEELMRQLYHYLKFKRMPLHIHLRLQMYYEYRFRKRYFREQSIMATLSEHLRYEIKLCTSRHLIGKVAIFKGLSKGVVGSIIGRLNLDIYLANDVIIQCDTLVEHWFLISYGTVAVVHKNGVEIIHMQDGECFGEVQIVTGECDVSIIAIEISEIFSMPRNDFLNYLSNDMIKRRIDDVVTLRQTSARINLERYALLRQEREEVLYKVRSGKILEQGRLRFR
ncbi:i[[h]] channel isoform e [Holotrichia oblita]|uniref:I[[h]] channel isoform e n=1 Tax=Holotrichia oblita TaxID=644536 RepID=A0ACB9SHI7_HOLOL|nr:i[[h]] channel isoform e [Holotrichia oblita]